LGWPSRLPCTGAVTLKRWALAALINKGRMLLANLKQTLTFMLACQAMLFVMYLLQNIVGLPPVMTG
jgi:hypothetical protein